MGQCKWPNNFKYKHECAHCAGPHPAVCCFKKKRVRMPLPYLRIFFLKVVMPVSLVNMLPWLHLYPGRKKVDMLINGFRYGFHLPLFSGIGCVVFVLDYIKI